MDVVIRRGSVSLIRDVVAATEVRKPSLAARPTARSAHPSAATSATTEVEMGIRCPGSTLAHSRRVAAGADIGAHVGSPTIARSNGIIFAGTVSLVPDTGPSPSPEGAVQVDRPRATGVSTPTVRTEPIHAVCRDGIAAPPANGAPTSGATTGPAPPAIAVSDRRVTAPASDDRPCQGAANITTPATMTAGAVTATASRRTATIMPMSIARAAASFRPKTRGLSIAAVAEKAEIFRPEGATTAGVAIATSPAPNRATQDGVAPTTVVILLTKMAIFIGGSSDDAGIGRTATHAVVTGLVRDSSSASIFLEEVRPRSTIV